jgi:hypothetical protein
MSKSDALEWVEIPKKARKEKPRAVKPKKEIKHAKGSPVVQRQAKDTPALPAVDRSRKPRARVEHDARGADRKPPGGEVLLPAGRPVEPPPVVAPQPVDRKASADMTVPTKLEIAEFYHDDPGATIKDLMRKFHGRVAVNRGIEIHKRRTT